MEGHIIEQMALIQFKRRGVGYFTKEEQEMKELEQEAMTELAEAVEAYEIRQCDETAKRMKNAKDFCLVRWNERANKVIAQATLRASRQKLLDLKFQTV